MPECIVCKGEYQPGLPCPRCNADTEPWEDWRGRPEEQGGLEGLCAFMEPHLYLPVLITLTAAAFGILALGSAVWEELQPDVQILIVALTITGCPIALLGTYESRHRIREQALLIRVQSGWRTWLGDPMKQAILTPAITLLLVFLVLVGIVSSPLLRKLLCIFVFVQGYCQEPPPEGLRAQLLEAQPFLTALMYLGFMVTFTYSSSLLLAIRYARRMNERLPLPIFLDDERLASIIRTAAFRQLDRLQGLSIRVHSTTGVTGGLDWEQSQRASSDGGPTRSSAGGQAFQQQARWGTGTSIWGGGTGRRLNELPTEASGCGPVQNWRR